ncbi:MAG: hypothetical protein H6549_12800 [Chitinophagales bacterium]|nr:hypothetical protein [Chitinophagales bacterium]
MKINYILLLLLISLSVFSCSKNGSNAKIKYEVTSSNGTFWVQYLDATESQTQENSTSNHWVKEFTNEAGIPRQLILQVVAIGFPNASLELSIFVNNSKVKTTTELNAAFLVYNLQ